MEWFSRNTSIAGTQIPNWALVLGAIIVIWLIYKFVVDQLGSKPAPVNCAASSIDGRSPSGRATVHQCWKAAQFTGAGFEPSLAQIMNL